MDIQHEFQFPGNPVCHDCGYQLDRDAESTGYCDACGSTLEPAA